MPRISRLREANTTRVAVGRLLYILVRSVRLHPDAEHTHHQTGWSRDSEGWRARDRCAQSPKVKITRLLINYNYN